MGERTRGGKHALDTDARFEYTDYTEPFLDDCQVIITDHRGVQFLASLVRTLYYYNTRWTDDGEPIDDPGVAATVSRWVTKLNREVLMACDITDQLTQLIVTVNQVALSIQQSVTSTSSGCGCGSGGAGTTDVPVSTVDTGVPGDPQAPIPDGFATRAEYEAYKCQVATWIVESTLKDAQWLQTVDIALLTSSGLIAGLLFVIPGANIVALLFFLTVTLAFAGYLQSVLGNWEQAITEAYDDLVCILYNAPTAGIALVNYQARTDEAIEAVSEDAVEIAFLKTLAVSWRNNEAFNKLFVEDALLNLTGIVGDCSTCLETAPCVATWAFALGTSGWVFEDVSPDIEGTSVGVYDATLEGLKITNTITNSPNKSAAGRWSLDLTGQNVLISVGDTIDALFSASTVILTRYVGFVIDGQFYFTPSVGSTQANVIGTATVAGQLEAILVQGNNSTGGGGVGFTNAVTVMQVALSLNATPDCPTGDV